MVAGTILCICSIMTFLTAASVPRHSHSRGLKPGSRKNPSVSKRLLLLLLLLLFSHSILPNSFVTPWTLAHQAHPSLGFPRQEYWSGLPFYFPEYIPDPGIESRSAALLADSLPLSHQGSILYICTYIYTLRLISITYFQIPV